MGGEEETAEWTGCTESPQFFGNFKTFFYFLLSTAAISGKSDSLFGTHMYIHIHIHAQTPRPITYTACLHMWGNKWTLPRLYPKVMKWLLWSRNETNSYMHTMIRLQ